jgi:hypothetical protein
MSGRKRGSTGPAGVGLYTLSLTCKTASLIIYTQEVENMNPEGMLIDADGHILEPPDLVSGKNVARAYKLLGL